MTSGFLLGSRSVQELVGVHKSLVAVVEHAIQITEQDFAVHDGIRTEDEQRELLRRGASKTMKSRHLIGEAVDLVPYINGKLRWEWPAIYPIALAMARASRDLDVVLTWGGVWDKRMHQYSGHDVSDMRRAVEEYCARHPGPDFIDGPHFQIEL